MKNIENYQLKKCIFMTLEDFKSLVKHITNGVATVEYEFGIYLEEHPENVTTENNIYWNEGILSQLSDYFGVEVTSYHSDDCEEYPCVWICYKE